jgi:hypothetical protein
MIVNKKLDRLKQWAGERMGGEVKTNVSDDFKALEQEMNLRHEGKLASDCVLRYLEWGLMEYIVPQGWSVSRSR